MMAKSPPPAKKSRVRAKRVSAQHTLERVRNNQRQHRARQRDHVAALEVKLKDSESTVSVLKHKIDTLQAELRVYRSQTGTSCNSLERPQQQPGRQGEDEPQSLSSTTPVKDSWEPRMECGPGESDMDARLSVLPSMDDDLPSLPRPTLAVDVALPPPGQPNSSLGGFPAQHDTVTLPEVTVEPPASASLLLQNSPPEPELTLIASEYDPGARVEAPSSTKDPNLEIWEVENLLPIQASLSTAQAPSAPFLITESNTAALGYPHQPPIEFFFESLAEDESTILCSEAYVLISQQNFKGISQRDVDSWLYSGFRRSCRPGEGCRVKTDLLLGLLGYISDVWSVDVESLISRT